jgi:hypothetical protein
LAHFFRRGFIIIVVQILEVEPPSQACLLAGMRVCAYWSTKYHYLHPGTIVKNTQVQQARILRFCRVKRYSVKVLQGNKVLRVKNTQVPQARILRTTG